MSSARAQWSGKASNTSAPMPRRWLPCPAKSNARTASELTGDEEGVGDAAGHERVRAGAAALLRGDHLPFDQLAELRVAVGKVAQLLPRLVGGEVDQHVQPVHRAEGLLVQVGGHLAAQVLVDVVLPGEGVVAGLLAHRVPGLG